MSRLHMAQMRGPRVSEKVVQQQLVTLLRSIGALVCVLGTTRRRGDYQGTCQTPGVPDLYVFLPAPPLVTPQGRGAVALWWEVKAEGGRLSGEQIAFREACLTRGVPYGTGGLDALTEFLIAGGWLKADNVPHYRRPTNPCTDACLAEIDTPSSVVARCSTHGRTHREAKASRVPEELPQ